MSMGATKHSGISRLAQGTLQLALQFWPAESREWGLAHASELPEAEGPLETLQWTLGGLMLFSRASVSHILLWMKNPPGSPFSLPAPGSDQPLLPRRSRFFTAALLAATLLVLFLPQSRLALSAARASWNGFEITALDRHTLEVMASRAEAEKDAQRVAFVALALPDSERAMVLADRAVALDPSLTWIYSTRFHRPEDVPMPDAWHKRSLARDPDNAFVHLATADDIANGHFQRLIAHRTPPQEEMDDAIVGDPEWIKQMELAVHSTRYDDYLSLHWALVCRAWDRHPTLSPSIIGYSLWSGRISHMSNLKTYARMRVHLAQQRRLAGQPEEASKILADLDGFGARMADWSQSRFGKMIGQELSREANVEFAALYAATGRKEEAERASARVQELEALQQSFHGPFMTDYLARAESLRHPAFLFQTFFVLFVIALFLAVLCYMVLDLRPNKAAARGKLWQFALCRAADYLPAAVLGFGLAFVLSFLPIARMLASFRSSAASPDAYGGLSHTFWTLETFPYFFQSHFDGSFFWWFVVIALSVLALALLWRNLRGLRRVQPSPL